MQTECGERRVAYLTRTLPVSDKVLAAAGTAKPTEVLRIASACMGSGCRHFDGADCRLAGRVARMLEPVVNGLPQCAIRPSCRWYRQEGKAACVRCPQMVTDLRASDERQRAVAGEE
jgi:hypothetical protein